MDCPDGEKDLRYVRDRLYPRRSHRGGEAVPRMRPVSCLQGVRLRRHPAGPADRPGGREPLLRLRRLRLRLQLRDGPARRDKRDHRRQGGGDAPRELLGSYKVQGLRHVRLRLSFGRAGAGARPSKMEKQKIGEKPGIVCFACKFGYGYCGNGAAPG